MIVLMPTLTMKRAEISLANLLSIHGGFLSMRFASSLTDFKCVGILFDDRDNS